MLPKWHILISFLSALILVLFFSLPLTAGIIIFLSSVLIDIDHYLIYIYQTKNLSLQKAFNWAISEGKKWCKLSKQEKRKYKMRIFLFHGIEFLVLLALLAKFHIFFFWVIIGFLIHMTADMIDLKQKGFPLYAKISPILVWQKNKNKKELK